MSDIEKMTEEQINTAYDKLLDAATIKANEDGKLTDEQVNELAKKLDEAADSDPVLASIKAAPAMAGNTTYGVEDHSNDEHTNTVKVKVNPETGECKQYLANEDGITLTTQSDDFKLEDYLDMKSYEADYIDLDNLEFSKSIRDEYNLSDDDCEKLRALLKRVQNKEEEIPYYAELPRGVQKFVDSMAILEGKPNSKSMKNTLAKTCIDTIFNEIAADIFQIDVEKLINTEIKRSGADFSDMYDNMIIGKKEKLYEAASKIEEESPEKADLLRQIADACEESYMMKDFTEAIINHKIKIRKIDIEKYDKVVREFNYKYINSKLNINLASDLVLCIPRHLATSSRKISPDKITPQTVVAFVVAFCKYCSNFSSENVVEHTFMYYFIKNILRLDVTPPGEAPSQFAQDLVDRITDILELIHEVYGY